MAEFASLPLFTDSWIADTAHLTRAERGLYMDLIILCWRSPECRIPNELGWISRKLNCDPDEMETLSKIISEFMSSTGNWLFQKRLRKEFRYTREKHKKQSVRAKSGWDKRKTRSHGNAERHGSGNAPSPSPSPSPSLDIKAEQQSKIAEAPAPQRIPDLETKLREAAGWTNHPAPNLFVTGPIEALIERGASLETDVLPVIRSRAPQVRGSPNWKYFVGPIQDAMADRTKAAAGTNGVAKTIEDRQAEARRRIQEHNAKHG